MLLGLFGAVSCVGLFLWLVTGSFRPAPPPPSVNQQLSDVRSSPFFSNDDVQLWPAALQGEGQSSYIFYSHSRAFVRRPGDGRFPPTDTLRIYDDSSTRISSSVVLAPTEISPDAQLTGDAEFFERRSLRDLIGAGAPQLVGVYSPANQPGAPSLPIILYWNETGKSYAMDALMQTPPSLAPVAHQSRTALAYRASYTRLALLQTHAASGPSYVSGYPVQDMAIVNGRNGPHLVFGYVAQTVGSPPRISLLEVQAWSIGQDQATGNPKLQTRCVLRDDIHRRFFVTPLAGLSYPTLLREYWEQFDPLALC